MMPDVLPRRRQWHPTPVLLPGKSHGQGSLVGCSPWGREESDTTERLPFHFSLSCIGEGNGNPLQCSCLENPRDGGAWWTAVYGVAESQTRLKWLSSSSSRGWGEGGIIKKSTGIFRAMKLFCATTTVVDICYYKFLQNHRVHHTKKESQCKLWALNSNDVYHRFLNCSKCTILEGLSVVGKVHVKQHGYMGSLWTFCPKLLRT